MRRALSLVLFSLIVCSGAAMAQLTGGGAPQIPAEPLVTLKGVVTSASGDELHGVVTATILDGWHINSNKPLADFSIPTALTFDPATAELVRADYPPHELRTFAFSGTDQLAVFEKTIRISFVVKAKPGVTALKANLHFQACNDKVCLRPDDATTEIATTVVAEPAGATPSATTATAAPPSGANFTPLSAAPKEGGPLFGSDIGRTFASHGLPLTLVAIFVLGLALNLTPCVYPLIPITVGYFSQQSGKRSRRTLLSVMYVIGIAITYSSLGVFAALSGKLFGAWLQLPAVLIFFALLMLVLASSMFGAWDIQIPHFISDRSGARTGLGGALIMGLLIGVVAAPCVGPFVISLLTLVSQLGNPVLGFLMFFVLALGLGVPYLLLGIFSSGLNAMPRSGMWMVQVKKAMGFVLVAMAFYFLRPLTGDAVFQYGVAASLLIGAGFLFFTKTAGPKGGNSMRLACGILLLVAGIAFAIPRGPRGGLAWTPYDAGTLASAAGKPVIIDFYADWCLPCKELDEKTFPDSRVSAELARFSRFKANLTSEKDPLSIALTKKYAIVGVPTLVFIGSDGKEIPGARLTGFEPPEKFVERLKSVK
jgi:thiol:disulfide interchange protein DsbD